MDTVFSMLPLLKVIEWDWTRHFLKILLFFGCSLFCISWLRSPGLNFFPTSALTKPWSPGLSSWFTRTYIEKYFLYCSCSVLTVALVFMFMVLRLSSIFCFNSPAGIIVFTLLQTAGKQLMSAWEKCSLVRVGMSGIVFVERCTA